MKLSLVKQLDNSFKLAYNSDYDKARKIKPGDILQCDIKKPRNYEFHKKFFSLINMVFDNQEIFENVDHLRKVLIIKSGYCDEIRLPNGEIILDAQSVSFSKMDELQFQELYEKIKHQIHLMFGFDKEEIDRNINQYY